MVRSDCINRVRCQDWIVSPSLHFTTGNTAPEQLIMIHPETTIHQSQSQKYTIPALSQPYKLIHPQKSNTNCSLNVSVMVLKCPDQSGLTHWCWACKCKTNDGLSSASDGRHLFTLNTSMIANILYSQNEFCTFVADWFQNFKSIIEIQVLWSTYICVYLNLIFLHSSLSNSECSLNE